MNMELTHRRSDYFDNEKDEFHMAVISRSTYEKINTKFTLVLKNHIKMDSGKTEESTFHKLFTRFEVKLIHENTLWHFYNTRTKRHQAPISNFCYYIFLSFRNILIAGMVGIGGTNKMMELVIVGRWCLSRGGVERFHHFVNGGEWWGLHLIFINLKRFATWDVYIFTSDNISCCAVCRGSKTTHCSMHYSLVVINIQSIQQWCNALYCYNSPSYGDRSSMLRSEFIYLLIYSISL